MAALENQYIFGDLIIYHSSYPGGAEFTAFADTTRRCLGVYLYSGGMRLISPDGDVPWSQVGVFERGWGCGADVRCQLWAEGAEWLCFSCDNPANKQVEQVLVGGSYTLPAQVQAVLVAGAVTADGVDYVPVSELRFPEDVVVSGAGTLILIR